MSIERIYPELAKTEHGQVVYGCNICKALTFQNLWKAESHCWAENKGKRRDNQWRHETILKKLPVSEVSMAKYRVMAVPVVDPREPDAD